MRLLSASKKLFNSYNLSDINVKFLNKNNKLMSIKSCITYKCPHGLLYLIYNLSRPSSR
jgi:hypothetical protein